MSPFHELVAELAAWLGVATALGAVGGYALCRASSGSKDAFRSADQQGEVLDGRIAALQQKQLEKDERLAHLQDELEALRSEHRATEERMLQFESLDKEASAVLIAQIESQLEELRAERDASGHELEQLRNENRSLQKRLDESADRLVSLERERMQSRGAREGAGGPAPAPRSAAAVPSRPVPGNASESVPEPVPEPHAIRLEVEKSMPLTVEQDDPSPLSRPIPTAASRPTPDPAIAISTGAGTGTGTDDRVADPGAERDLADLPAVGDDDAERLALIGVGTNLALLRKAGTRLGRNGLAKSTRLDEPTLLRWVRQADLLRAGMRGADLKLLEDAGIRGLRDLADVDPERLLPRLSPRTAGKGRDVVDAAAVRRWVERAGELDSLVED